MINWISSASCHWELQCGSHNCRQGCVTPLTCPVLALIRSCILHRVAFPADSHLIGSENEPVQLINFSLFYTPEHVYMFLLVFCLSLFLFAPEKFWLCIYCQGVIKQTKQTILKFFWMCLGATARSQVARPYHITCRFLNEALVCHSPFNQKSGFGQQRRCLTTTMALCFVWHMQMCQCRAAQHPPHLTSTPWITCNLQYVQCPQSMLVQVIVCCKCGYYRNPSDVN